MDKESKPDADDERPQLCPTCGVTMGIILDEDGGTRYGCLECGFSEGSWPRTSSMTPAFPD